MEEEKKSSAEFNENEDEESQYNFGIGGGVKRHMKHAASISIPKEFPMANPGGRVQNHNMLPEMMFPELEDD